ncbi:potassium channel family protein [Thermomonospora amylolytica]|uniref:potassium channel family protein n=1 Tax=Thermomonospora amylolytica TaxID=1411117 RepID=UPI0013003707|nr:potassium channel family protein [Thermomonospora amylolytica]
MPVLMMRVLHSLRARAWRVPALVMAAALVAGWTLIWTFEPRDAEIRDPLNYLWYFFVSGTTTGYGDLFPVSAGGRIGGALVVGAGLTAGLMLFAELTVWMARGRELKANGMARLHHEDHVVVVGYEREMVRHIVAQLRPDPKYRGVPIVALFWEGQLTGENPDPDEYDVVRFDETGLERARVERARTVFVAGRTDDETVRVMLTVHARAADPRATHFVAGLRDSHRPDLRDALALIDPDVETVDLDDYTVVADVIRNPGVAAVYSNMASTLDSDGSLFRVDIPEGAGEWPRLDLAVFLLRRGCTLLAVGDSHRPNARFRLLGEPGETVRGGQSLAVVARERPEPPWEELTAARR